MRGGAYLCGRGRQGPEKEKMVVARAACDRRGRDTSYRRIPLRLRPGRHVRVMAHYAYVWK